MNNALVLYNLYIMHKKCDGLLEVHNFETNTQHFESSYSQFTEKSTLCHHFLTNDSKHKCHRCNHAFGIITREKEVLRKYNQTN